MLINIELSSAKLNEGKSHFGLLKIVIIGYTCDYNERHPKIAKIMKIIKWPPCINITKARAFIGVCVYY